MYMTDQQKMEARALAAALDKLTREPKRFSPSAPWIIPATMIFVATFAFVCLIIKLFLNYLSSRHNKTKNFGLSEASSPDIPTTPTDDRDSMATTATMRTKGSLRLSTRKSRESRKNKPPPVSLYQIKQKQSPGSVSNSSRLKTKAALKAMSRVSRNEANKSLSRESTRQIDGSDDNLNNTNQDDNGNDSPTNMSQHSDDITDEIQNAQTSSGVLYAAAGRSQTNNDENVASNEGPPGAIHHNNNQPEVHIVTIRELDDNLQHSQPTWPQTESEI